MATISLKIAINNGAIMKTIQLDPSTTVYDACRIIREKLLEADSTEPKEYGLFLTSEEDNKKGIWLEASRTLDYYILRNNDVLHYMRKMRNLRVRMLDGTVKTLLVDDSQIVANLMVVICTKIGITNYDEYGLVREDQKDECDPCEKPNYGTLTLKRKHQEKERDAKMDQLRKKLRTDDEVNWVEPSKTLREQGIDVTETLLLRRKLFFSDRNVDSRDPVQLNLLYVQARDAILDGTHPVTSDKACEFAGIQCQIQFGDHKEDKHTPGFLDLKEFLPQSYVKTKGIEKRVWKEHKQHIGLSELDAKVLYTKSARALSTYGVAFFLVKEKMKGKNKLVPRLLGVTKDSVLRLDERTKEILQSWPLTTVRRWCASPNTFTLDFGDYSDQYYSVQTSEAEQILQVIAGYIDIILRKQRAKEHLGVEGDEGSAMMEDTVAPHRANIIQHDTFKPKNVNTESVAKPAVLRPGEGPKAFAVSHTTTLQQTTISGQIITGHTPPAVSQSQQSKSLSIQSEPQRALLSTISEGKEIIRHTQEELTRAVLPPVTESSWRGVTAESSRRVVSRRVAHMNAATAELVTLTSGPTEEVDHTAVGAAITTITENLPEMTKGVSMLAALMEDEDNGDKLLDATRKLCTAFSDLLTAAQPHDDKEPRQHLLNAASKVGEASTSVLQTIGEEPQDKETQDILLSLAKAVANTTAALVLKAKNVAAQCKDDQQLQSSIISAATQCALATSQLVACTKVVAPTIQNPLCREQLSRATRQVHIAVETLLESCDTQHRAGGEELVTAASAVTEALKTLLQHCETERVSRSTQAAVVESVVTASEGVTSARDVTQLVQNARALGHATATLVTHIKTEAERQPSENQRKLLAAAKLLADATARMVEAARQCASSPQDREKQETLRRAAEELRFITVDYAQGQDIVGAQIARLQDTARQATSSATELITAAHNAIQYNTNKYSQEQLLSECSTMSSELGRVLEASRLLNKNEPGAAFHLIAATESFLQSSSHVPSSARAAAATVPHPLAHKELAAASSQLTQDSHALESAINRAKISCKGLELDSALEIINSIQQNLDQPPQGPPMENPSQQISIWSRSAQSCVAQMWSAVSRSDLPAASRLAPRLATDLHQLAGAVSHVQHPDREKMVEATKQTMYSAQVFVEYIQKYTTTSERVDVHELRTVHDTLTQSLDRVMESVPSHAELDEAIENVNETLHVIEEGECPTSERTYSELQSSLHTAAADLHDAATSIVDNSTSSSQLCTSSKHFNNAFNSLLPLAMEMSSHHEDIESRTEIISAMKSLTINSSRLLSNAKSYSQDLTRANGRTELTESARAVTESINKLVDVCTEASPGQKECAAAVRTIESTRPLLRRPTSPISQLSYFATLDACVAQSKALSEGMSGIASSAKSGATSEFCSHVTRTAEHVAALVENAAHQAYLIGVSHVDSTPGRCGLISVSSLSRAAAAITQAAATLRDPATHRHQVLAAATEIAKYTSALCNLCRVASAKSESAAKRHFVQAAKDVANSTADLVKEIKKIDNDVSLDYTKENMARCAAATLPLESAVKSLCQFANSPEFAPVPAQIPPQATASMDDILDTAGHIITSSCGMLQSASYLLPAPTDRAHWHSLATNSKHLSDHIKALLTSIREKVPGQVELAEAQEQVVQMSQHLERAAMDLADNKLPPAPGSSMEGFSEQIESSAAEALERLEALRRAAKCEAEHIPHYTVHTMQYIEVLTSSVVGCVRHMTSWKAQGSLLDRARTVLEALTAALRAAAASQGNHNATSLHPRVDSTFSSLSEAMRELVESTRGECALQGDIGPCLETLQRDMQRLYQNRMSLVGSYEETDSFVDYQTRMVETAKDIARLASDMRAKSATCPSELAVAGAALTARYSALAHDALPAALAAPQPQHADTIRSSVIEVGEAIEALVKAGGSCRQEPNKENQADVCNKATACNEKVIKVLVALRSGSRGTQACIDAATTLAALSSELATTVLFATAGTLQSDKEGDTFSHHRESILKTAKALVEETKRLVGGAAGTQDQLADAAQSATATVVQLCEVVKLGAMSLGSNSAESQVLLLNGARDVTQALRDLAIATKGASGHHVSHPHMETLKHAAKRHTEASKRWSLPAKQSSISHQYRRRSINLSQRDMTDSETDLFVSDQEDELLKLLDYSSQDDDVSPGIFHDHCEETITYIDRFLSNPPIRTIDEDLNDKYNVAAKNSLVNMNWRVLKYGENIFLGEVKELVDLSVDIFDKAEIGCKREKIDSLKATSELDGEMKRLSQALDDLETDETFTDIEKATQTIRTVVEMKPAPKIARSKIEDKILMQRLKNPIFKVEEIKPIDLAGAKKVSDDYNESNLKPLLEDLTKDIIIEEYFSADEDREVLQEPSSKNVELISFEKENSSNDMQQEIVSYPAEAKSDKAEEQMIAKAEFWSMFKDDTEVWKALAKRNLEKMEETRKELARFSGNELVLGEIQSEINKYEKEKETLQSFIDDVDSKALEYDEKYEEMVLRLIDFAKKDFSIYKGFDPLIEQLKRLSDIEIDNRRNFKDIDTSNFTYDELCVLEYYSKIVKTFKSGHRVHFDKDKYVKKAADLLERSKQDEDSLQYIKHRFPKKYYAGDWWSIYRDILKNREEQFGSLDQWWNFYDNIIRNTDFSSEHPDFTKQIAKYQADNKRRPQSRLKEHLKMLDEVKTHSFLETENVTTNADESVMVTNVTSLLKTVKAVEDEHTRGIRALESTIEAINQEISVLLSSAPPPSTATAEELIRHTRHMTVATTRAVAAANSNKQDDLTAAANGGRKTVVDLLHCCKGAAFSAETTELREQTIEAGRDTAMAYRDLLQLVLECAQSQGNVNDLAEKSRAVAAALHNIIAHAQKIKGSEWVDPEDPTVIAETELLGAAASIDAAARKLDSLRPRRSIAVQEADESLNFDEMILEAARAIVAATSALVRAASSAQRELIDTGAVSRRPAMSSDDGQWSEGLVSGARLVAAAAHSLVEAANALVQGVGSEERLISSARQVASSTAQLLVACKVKADPSSESTRRLQWAGAEVIRSTDNLVRAARDSITHEEERSLVLNRRMVGGIAQEIDARSEVLRIEKELEEARGRLSAIRQAKYKLRGDTSGDETEGWTSDVSQQPIRLQTPNSSYINTTYSPNSTHSHTHNQSQNTTNLSSHISNLHQSVHGLTHSPSSPGYTQHSPGYIPTSPGYNQTTTGLNQSAGFNQSATGFNQSNQSANESQTNGSFGQGPTFSSFRPQDDAAPKNYEGFTTRCETRLYDQPRSVSELSKTEEQRMYESSQFIKQEQKYDSTKLTSPLSPKFNARNLKHDSDKNQSFFPNLNRPKYGDGIGQSFTEHQKSSEAIPGGHKQSEFTIKSQSYQSYPQKDISFTTSTPTKFDAFERKDLNQYKSTDLVKAATPDYDRVASPYGKEVYSHSAPNYLEETTTEVKDVPNGTQKITTTKIYSSSPVNLTSTHTKFEPIKLEGIDELSKFDNDSKYSTLDSKYSVDSKLSSDTSRSFMRPSEFQASDFQSSSNVTKVLKPAPKDLTKEIDNIDKKFSKQTITSERIEKRSVMTSSHKQETKSTVTKKFGNV